MTRSAGNVFVCIHLDRARGVCIHSRATAAANHPSRAQATYSGSKVGGFHIGANFLGEQHSSCLSQYRGYIYIPKVSKIFGARMRMILPICSAAHPYITRGALHSAVQDLYLLFNAPEPTTINPNSLRIPSTARKRPSDDDPNKSAKGAA